MTEARLIATGRGKILGVRLSIAGCPTEFVSDPSMETTTADGRARKRGLRTDGVVIQERSNPIDVVPETSSMTLEIVDAGAQATNVFAHLPEATTWLTTALPSGAGDQTLAVASSTGFSNGDVVHLNQEAIKIGTVGVGEFTGCTRGYWDTDRRAHYVEDGADLRTTEVVDFPRTYVGRRAKLYVYGEGDSATGDGTLWWTGLVSTPPKLDGGVWTISVDSTARILDQTVGEGLGDPAGVRGIFYHGGCNLRVHVEVLSTNAVTGTVSEERRFDLAASAVHYETQEEFCVAFNAAAATALAPLANEPTLRAVPDGDGWRLEARINASTARYVRVTAQSPIDGRTIRIPVDNTGAAVTSVAVSQVVYFQWEPGGPPGARTVPRGGFDDVEGITLGYDTANPALRRLYVGGDVSLSGVTAVVIDWPAFGGQAAYAQPVFVQNVDTANRSLEVHHVLAPDGTEVKRIYTRAGAPKIKIAKDLGIGHIGDALSSMVTNSADEVNRGGGPAITSNEIDTASWSTVLDEATRDRPAGNGRKFVLGSDVELAELVRHECRLLSVWVGFTSTGKLTPIRLRPYVETDPDVATVEVLALPMPTWQCEALGSLRGAIVKTGYDAYQDDWVGPTTVLQDVTARSRNPLAPMLEIEPRSIYEGSSAFLDVTTHQQIKDLVRPLVSTYGAPYAIVQFDAPLTAFNVNLGEGISFTPSSDTIPNWPLGTRAARSYTGTVIGRTINLRSGRITFEVFTTGLNVAGYSPSWGITAQSEGDPNVWTLTVRNGDPWSIQTWGEGTDVPSDFFAEGMEIVVRQFNVASPTRRTGSVTTVVDGDSTVKVTLDSAWTPSTDKWLLCYDVASNASLTAAQKRYAYWAGRDRRIDFSSSTVARVFSG